MSVISVGEKFRIYLENGKGQLLELDALSASVTMTCNEPEPRYMVAQTKTEINLVGIGPIAWTNSSEFVRKKKQALEWKCDWCGHINPINARYCGHKDKHSTGCGASRSFILDI